MNVMRENTPMVTDNTVAKAGLVYNIIDWK